MDYKTTKDENGELVRMVICNNGFIGNLSFLSRKAMEEFGFKVPFYINQDIMPF